jgi:hypothetical protein
VKKGIHGPSRRPPEKSSHVSGMLAAGAIRALTLTQFFFHIHNTAGFM